MEKQNLKIQFANNIYTNKHLVGLSENLEDFIEIEYTKFKYFFNEYKNLKHVENYNFLEIYNDKLLNLISDEQFLLTIKSAYTASGFRRLFLHLLDAANLSFSHNLKASNFSNESIQFLTSLKPLIAERVIAIVNNSNITYYDIASKCEELRTIYMQSYNATHMILFNNYLEEIYSSSEKTKTYK